MQSLDFESAKQLALCRIGATKALAELRELRHKNQDDSDFLLSTVNKTIRLEKYAQAIKEVLTFNQYKDLI